MIKYESEVFSDCGAWKNFLDLEDSISLDELLTLYDASFRRQNRLHRTVAMAMGAEMEDEEEDYHSNSKENSQPAYLIDPSRGGQATPLFGEEQVYQLPIGLGYSTQ